MIMRTSKWKEISALEVYPRIFHESKNVCNAIFGEKQAGIAYNFSLLNEVKEQPLTLYHLKKY